MRILNLIIDFFCVASIIVLYYLIEIVIGRGEVAVVRRLNEGSITLTGGQISPS